MLQEITPYGITHGNSHFAAFASPEAGTNGCKAALTWVVVTSQDSLPAKDSHLSQK